MLGKLADHEIDTLLQGEIVGRLGIYAAGKIYVVPIGYVFDGNALYSHTYDGQKLEMMRANPNVCFEVDHIAKLAVWQSAIVWGTFEELTGDLANYAIDTLAMRLREEVPGETAGPVGRASGRHGVAFRINISEKTGRCEQP